MCQLIWIYTVHQWIKAISHGVQGYFIFPGPVYNKVPHVFRETGDGLYSLDWTPIKPGDYDVDVKYGDVIPVWGSPMKFKAFDSTKVSMLNSRDSPQVGERYLMKCR
jgi:hypothetical protein